MSERGHVEGLSVIGVVILKRALDEQDGRR